MAKRFKVKQYTGKLTRASGNPAHKKLNATRKQVLELLNDRENVPAEFKDVPKAFIFFNYNEAKTGDGYDEFLIRVDKVDVDDVMIAFVKDLLEPGWSTQVEKAFEIRRYRPYRKNIQMREEIFGDLNVLLTEDDIGNRGVLVASIREKLEVQFK